MDARDFDYHLPEKFIAQRPVEPRDSSRLLVVDRKTGKISHTIFKKLPEYLDAGDVLVANDTKVFPARFAGYKEGTGARIEVLLLSPLSSRKWQALVRPSRRVAPGTRICFGPRIEKANASVHERVARNQDGFAGTVDEELGDGKWTFCFAAETPRDLPDRLGEVALPPYIREPIADTNRYQTVYAENKGSVAAPTAGLHFTQRLINRLEARGIMTTYVTLNIGLDTFRPLDEGEVADHRMHGESFNITASCADAVNEARRERKRIVAVGTSSVRVLETISTLTSDRSEIFDGAARPNNPSRRELEWLLPARSGATNLFIYPGYKFKVVNSMITNFHLPRSSTLVMVAAFCGKELIMKAYEEAMKNEYRFLSFGDAMLIL